jgi:hypothetical protein
MPGDFFLNYFANPWVKLLAHSPLHGLVDKSVVLITFTLKKSGRTITVPANYLQDGREVDIISLRRRTWWRNLKGGAAVLVQLAGKKHNGWAIVMEELPKVAEVMEKFGEANPEYARMMGLQTYGEGKAARKDLLNLARERVAVKITLS